MSDEFTDKYTDIKPELVFQPFEDKVDDIKTNPFWNIFLSLLL